jgi:hypothetical protein
MAGVGYTVGGPRVSTSFAFMAGPAFNSLSQGSRTGPVWAIDIENSFAWRPGLSTWIDVSRRVALNVSVGHVITRPRVTWLDAGRVASRPLRADSTLLSAGLAFKVF